MLSGGGCKNGADRLKVTIKKLMCVRSFQTGLRKWDTVRTSEIITKTSLNVWFCTLTGQCFVLFCSVSNWRTWESWRLLQLLRSAPRLKNQQNLGRRPRLQARKRPLGSVNCFTLWLFKLCWVVAFVHSYNNAYVHDDYMCTFSYDAFKV